MNQQNIEGNGNGKRDSSGAYRRRTSALQATAHFLVDYGCRHAHPVNAVLHLIGVPAVLFGLYRFFACSARVSGLFLIVFGYLLQYLGHKSQGNEVGEVILLKRLYALMRSRLAHRRRGGAHLSIEGK